MSDNPMLEFRRRLLDGEWFDDLPDSIDELQQALRTAGDSFTRFDIWKRLRAHGVEPTESDTGELYGVVGEYSTPEASMMIFGLCDGTASVYTSTGGGVLGGGGSERVREAIKRLIAEAAPYSSELPVVSDYLSSPPPGQFRLSLLTPRGVQAIEVQESELSSEQHHMFAVYAAWQELVTQLRLTDPQQFEEAAQQSAAAYANCLLTLMWENSLEPQTIVDGQPVPDLFAMGTKPEDAELLASIELPLDDVPARDVANILLHLSGFRWFRPFRQTGTLEAALATADSQTVDVSFEVQKSRDERGRRCVSVRNQ